MIFFPISMNYLVDIVRDPYGNEFIAPHHSYDLTNNYEITDGSGMLNETDCYNQIVTDLLEIKNMGFNSIRLVGLDYGTNNLTAYPAFIS